MNQIIRGLRNFGLRIVPVFLLLITVFATIPSFGYSELLQAQSGTRIIQADKAQIDEKVLKDIKERAEDLGDAPNRRIGNTGLGNIRDLGTKIPEAAELKVRQTRVTLDPDEQDKQKALGRVEKQVENKYEK